MTVTADGWIEVTVTVDGWIGDTVVSCTDVVVIVAVEDGDAIATISCGVWETAMSGKTGDKVTEFWMVTCLTVTLKSFPCPGKGVMVGSKLLMSGSEI